MLHMLLVSLLLGGAVFSHPERAVALGRLQLELVGAVHSFWGGIQSEVTRFVSYVEGVARRRLLSRLPSTPPTPLEVVRPLALAAPTLATPPPPPPKDARPLALAAPVTYITSPVIERVEDPVRVVSAPDLSSYATKTLLTAELEKLRKEMSKIVYAEGPGRVSSPSAPSAPAFDPTPLWQALARSTVINQIREVAVTDPAIDGGTISDSTITTSSFSGSTGTFTSTLSTSASLVVSGTGTSTLAGDVAFDTNTLYVDSLNNRVGVGTSSPTDTLAIAGPIFLGNTTPSVTGNRLYANGGDLYTTQAVS